MNYIHKVFSIICLSSLISCVGIGYKEVSTTPIFLREVDPYQLEAILTLPLCVQNLPSTTCSQEKNTNLGMLFTDIYEEQLGEQITVDELLEILENGEESIFSEIMIQKLASNKTKDLKNKGRIGDIFYQFIIPDTEDNNLGSFIIGVSNTTVSIEK